MSTETRNLGIRLDPELNRRLERFESKTGVGAVTLGRNAIIAALDYFEAHKRITFPLAMVDSSSISMESIGLNESPPAYGSPVKVVIEGNQSDVVAPQKVAAGKAAQQLRLDRASSLSTEPANQHATKPVQASKKPRQ